MFQTIHTLVSSELNKDYSKEYFVTHLPALEPSMILFCLWPVVLAHWLRYIRPKHNFIAELVWASTMVVTKKQSISCKNSNFGTWSSLSSEVFPLYMDMKRIMKESAQLRNSKFIYRFSLKKGNINSPPGYSLLCKTLELEIIKLIYTFYRFIFVHNNVRFSHQDIRRRDDKLSCFKIMKLTGFCRPSPL